MTRLRKATARQANTAGNRLLLRKVAQAKRY